MKCINCGKRYDKFHENVAVDVCRECYDQMPEGYVYEVRTKTWQFFNMRSLMNQSEITRLVNTNKFLCINKHIIATDEIISITQVEIIRDIKEINNGN